MRCTNRVRFPRAWHCVFLLDASSFRPMPSASSFSHSFAHLVWLLVYRPAHQDDQKKALRATLLATRSEGCRLSLADLGAEAAELSAQAPRSEALGWLTELSTRMGSHSVRVLDVHARPKAAEVLGLARVLAMTARPNDDGRAFDQEISALAPTTFAVYLGRDGFVRTPTPPRGMHAVGLRSAMTPALGTAAIAAAVSERRTAPAAFGSGGDAALPNDRSRMIESAIMPTGERPASDLVMRLRGELSTDEAPRLLDEIGRAIEDAARASQWVSVVDLAHHLMERERTVQHPDLKRAFGVQFRRMAKPPVMRGMAQLLTSRRDVRDEVLALLQRLGAPATDVLVDLLVAAESSAERRAYRDAIILCPDAVEPLQHLLRDHRWFVVRNAAELLGEMQAREADQDLINTLRHKDARVRRAATLALIRLGTPRALHTIVHALSDTEASVRLKAAQGLGAVRNPRAEQALLAALDTEQDLDVVVAILHALGKHGTDVVVARLVKESASGSLLKRRPAARRLAAISALGESGAHAAGVVLRKLSRDRDASVRELASRVLGEAVEAAAR